MRANGEALICPHRCPSQDTYCPSVRFLWPALCQNASSLGTPAYSFCSISACLLHMSHQGHSFVSESVWTKGYQTGRGMGRASRQSHGPEPTAVALCVPTLEELFPSGGDRGPFLGSPWSIQPSPLEPIAPSEVQAGGSGNC